ncbi:hypothetical protein C1646_756252 [Rhizophagus diaphanus]|nr:hypothetical protein C1646_756252 [Rhizophagus diaphanus] [Rhizophagus sp. MUCL 43196]
MILNIIHIKISIIYLVLILPSDNIIDVMFYIEIITIEKEPDLDLKKLSFNEWKFVPKSEISICEYISVKHDKNTLKTIEISFNAESDVMIQTNYPLPNVFIKVGFHSDEGRTFHNEGYTGSKYAEKWGEINEANDMSIANLIPYKTGKNDEIITTA